VRVGALLQVADGVYLLPGADAEAASRLERLPQPFTVSQAREVLGTTRRVAVPVLELLARQGRTQRLPDSRHRLAPSATAQVRSQATGSPSTTQLPGGASRPMNRPVNGDRIS
jgi:Elongation factor SelB, winged helix